MAKAFLITPFNPERAGHEDPEVFPVTIQHAAATATSTISLLEQSEALLGIPELDLEYERGDAYLFAAACTS